MSNTLSELKDLFNEKGCLKILYDYHKVRCFYEGQQGIPDPPLPGMVIKKFPDIGACRFLQFDEYTVFLCLHPVKDTGGRRLCIYRDDQEVFNLALVDDDYPRMIQFPDRIAYFSWKKQPLLNIVAIEMKPPFRVTKYNNIDYQTKDNELNGTHLCNGCKAGSYCNIYEACKYHYYLPL
jgi:hypothetical protein